MRISDWSSDVCSSDRGRLVGDQQVRLAEQRHGNHHALAHTAGELVRVEVEALPGRGDADAVQQRDGALACRRLLEALVLDQHLGHLLGNAQVGVQRGHRVLEDHRQGDAADFVQLARREPQDLFIAVRSEEHTSELQSLMRISYAVFCLKKKKQQKSMYYKTNTKSQTQEHNTTET